MAFLHLSPWAFGGVPRKKFRQLRDGSTERTRWGGGGVVFCAVDSGAAGKEKG